MNEKLIEKLSESTEQLIDFIEKTGETTVDFAKEQVPLVIQEVLNWGFYSNIIYGSINLIVALVCVYFVVWIWKKEYKGEDTHPFIMFVFVPVFISIPTFLHGIYFMITALKISVAPRLYLIEQLHTLIKKGS